MADINQKTSPEGIKAPDALRARDAGQQDSQPPRDPELLDLAELLFFAYRDFTREPDKILGEIGFGRAHHRVLHFVNRHPGMRVADLLDILQITKQSLGRVLKQLVDDGFISQEEGKTDRRQRLLYTTSSGQDLAERLAAPQLSRIARALKNTGAEENAYIEKFLRQMIGDTQIVGFSGEHKNNSSRNDDIGEVK